MSVQWFLDAEWQVWGWNSVGGMGAGW